MYRSDKKKLMVRSSNQLPNFQQSYDESSRGKQSFEGFSQHHHGPRPGFHLQGPRLSQLKATNAASSDSLLTNGKLTQSVVI